VHSLVKAELTSLCHFHMTALRAFTSRTIKVAITESSNTLHATCCGVLWMQLGFFKCSMQVNGQCHPVLCQVAEGGEKEGGGSQPDLQV